VYVGCDVYIACPFLSTQNSQPIIQNPSAHSFLSRVQQETEKMAKTKAPVDKSEKVSNKKQKVESENEVGNKHKLLLLLDNISS
jgi:hypothetical protein